MTPTAPLFCRNWRSIAPTASVRATPVRISFGTLIVNVVARSRRDCSPLVRPPGIDQYTLLCAARARARRVVLRPRCLGAAANLDLIPIGDDPPNSVNVVIEVPIGGEPVKYEFDKKSGALFVDRILHTAMRYPANYGFIPHTLSPDGDPIDALVIARSPFIPGAWSALGRSRCCSWKTSMAAMRNC